jgi:hypothetical protein
MTSKPPPTNWFGSNAASPPAATITAIFIQPLLGPLPLP